MKTDKKSGETSANLRTTGDELVWARLINSANGLNELLHRANLCRVNKQDVNFFEQFFLPAKKFL